MTSEAEIMSLDPALTLPAREPRTLFMTILWFFNLSILYQLMQSRRSICTSLSPAS